MGWVFKELATDAPSAKAAIIGKYIFKYKYTANGVSGWVYLCIQHQKCAHCIRIANSSPVRISEKGSHAIQLNEDSCGISAAVRSRVDELCFIGLPPRKIWNKLMSDGMPRSVLPDLTQIGNRKAYYLKSLCGETWEKTGHLSNWIQCHKCTSKEAFKSWDNDNVMVVETFGCKGGFTFTSKTLANSIIDLASEQPNGIALSVDGTYKLSNWTLLILCAQAIVRSSDNKCEEFQGNESFRRSARPIMFAQAPEEDTDSVTCLLRSFQKVASEFCDLTTCNVVSVTFDHSQAIFRAVTTVFPAATKLDCYAHVMRNAKDMCWSNKQYFEHTARQQILQCHLSASKSIFAYITKSMISQWKKDGEIAAANHFQSAYLTEAWHNWYISAAAGKLLPGILPDNNPIESFNRELKSLDCITHALPMASFCNLGISKILGRALDMQNQIKFRRFDREKQIDLISNSPIPVEMIDKAQLLASGGRSMKVNDNFYFNTREYAAEPMTLDRIAIYVLIKHGGHCDPTARFSTAVYNSRSLHEVIPVSDNEYRVFRCDCKNYIKTSYICSHVLVALHLAQSIDLSFWGSSLYERMKGKGRRKSRNPALVPQVKDNLLGKQVVTQLGQGMVYSGSPSSKWKVRFWAPPERGSRCAICRDCQPNQCCDILTSAEVVTCLLPVPSPIASAHISSSTATIESPSPIASAHISSSTAAVESPSPIASAHISSSTAAVESPSPSSSAPVAAEGGKESIFIENMNSFEGMYYSRNMQNDFLKAEHDFVITVRCRADSPPLFAGRVAQLFDESSYLSDTIIEFCLYQLLPKCNSMLGMDQFKYWLEVQKRNKRPKNSSKVHNLTRVVSALFIHGCSHFVCVIVDRVTEEALVLDSLNDPGNIYAIEKELERLSGRNYACTTKAVPRQKGVDCALHTIMNCYASCQEISLPNSGPSRRGLMTSIFSGEVMQYIDNHCRNTV